jgi:hypothetical protein
MADFFYIVKWGLFKIGRLKTYNFNPDNSFSCGGGCETAKSTGLSADNQGVEQTVKKED